MIQLSKRAIIYQKLGGIMLKKIFIIIAITFSLPVFSFDLHHSNASVLYEKINPAIVSVDSHLSDGVSCGTGCIIESDGTILTSAHIIEEGRDIIITMSNGEDYKAKVIKKFGENKDIALLKISVPYELKTVRLGDSSRVKVGDSVLAIGNPFGFNGTLTKGIISRIDYAKNRLQTDAAINPGSSGGPLLNTHGEIIGINQAIYNPDNNISNIGIGFATPVNLIKEYLNE
jgi:serine protease Do